MITRGDILSNGGFSTVYNGTYNRHDVAIKIMKRNTITDMCYTREIDALTHLNHPGIPKLYAHFSNDTEHTIVVELMDGFESTEAMGMDKGTLVSLCDVVKHVHDSGWAHCDIKPENIIAGGDQVGLVDFAFACRKDAPFVMSLGTNGFEAPEIKDKSTLWQKHDIYALGKTIDELYFGDASDFTSCPALGRLIKDMTLRNPIRRPDITSVVDRIKQIQF